MKKLTVIAAGLGWHLLERRKATSIAGLRFEPRPSVFPAVTCVAQATLRTGLRPEEHGMLSNGVWLDDLQKPAFWEQSCRFVKGKRLWSRNSGVFFFQQSLGEDVELIISPAPIHKHGGGMVMSCYTRPTELAATLRRSCGTFPLWRYWGPLASPKVGRKCIDYFEVATELHDVDEGYLYLPTLDYAAQKYGPDSPRDLAAFAEFTRQTERVAALCERRGCALEVLGDYEITKVSEPPVMPNVTLRDAGLFRTREVAGMAYPDFYQSRAFALCDHEFCILYGEESARARDILLATGQYETQSDLADERLNGRTILLAKSGSWCDYRWWTNPREAPDFASHVDIHNKPGYDPAELFLFCRGTVRGTHGRKCEVAHAKA